MNKQIFAGVAAASVVLLIPAVGVIGFGVSSLQLLSGSPAALGCTAPGTNTATDPSASATTPTVQIGAGDDKPLNLTQAQQNNAATVIAIGKAFNVPSRGVQVALMTALQESNLRNLANPTVAGSQQHANDGTGSNHDSVGIFQQRANWGSVDKRMQPTYQAKAFFGGPLGPNHGTPRGLLDIPNWQTMSLGKAAQAVQISAFPSAYTKWEATAAAIMSNEGIIVTADTAAQTVSNGGGCTSDGSDTNPAGTQNASWKAPNGKTGADMVAYAEQFVGKVPYSGACGSAGSPDAGWCCTGFVYYMYHQVLGINLPSPVVSGQLAQAHQIPASEAQAGDLVAWVGYHVGIYDGHGGLIHSPDWGRKLTHAKSYNFTIGSSGPTFWRVNALGNGTGNW